jgi:hypothetical protein
MPSGRVDLMKTKSLLHFRPNADCEPTLEKDVRGRFLQMVAKLTSSICRSNTILEDQPSKRLALGRCPRFPNQRRHGGLGVTKKLHAINRLGRVASIIELPKN